MEEKKGLDKPTHLLIPIKDIKPELEAMAEILIEDIKSSKKISLDEESIEKKAEMEFPYSNSDRWADEHNAYKKALQDLLK